MGTQIAQHWTVEDENTAETANRGLSTSSYIRGSRLGSGGWSVAHKVLRVRDQRVFAGKSSRAAKELRREARILRSLQHEHIIKLIDWQEEPNKPESILLVTELCPCGTLQDRIHHASPNMGRMEVACVVLQIAQALEYLHNLQLFHSDVKPRNILIRTLTPMDVVLVDCADVKKTASASAYRLQGTQMFWSPQIPETGRHVGAADDVWALGITMMGMLGQSPSVQYVERGVREYPKICSEHLKLLMDINPHNGLVRVLSGLLAWQPENRLDASRCVTKVRELQLGMQQASDVDDCELGINAPEGFRRPTFW